MKVAVSDYEEKTIYHSPETPGYSAWCVLWRSSRGDLRLAFQQVTGPVDQPELRLNEHVILSSSDEADSWQFLRAVQPRQNIKARESGIYAGAEDTTLCGHGLICLADGTLIAGLWAGGDKPSGFVQRSQDDGLTWSVPIYLMDPAKFKAYPTMFHQLRDGRLVLLAGIWDRDRGEVEPGKIEKTMFVSNDEGRTWGPPITIIPFEQGGTEESDFCEMPNGDLFWVHRAAHYNAEELPPLAEAMFGIPNAYSNRLQSFVRKRGDGWEPEAPSLAPFPHAGFPELLLTKEGILLYISETGYWWTADFGANWHKLDVAPASYYARAMQLPDGRILVIGHDGGDDVYGEVDQFIRQQTFRLEISAS